MGKVASREKNSRRLAHASSASFLIPRHKSSTRRPPPFPRGLSFRTDVAAAPSRAHSRAAASRGASPPPPPPISAGAFKKKTTRRIVVEPNTSLRARGDVDGEKTVATPPRPKNAGTRTPDRRAAFTAALSGEALHSSERALLPARARERSLRLVPSRDASSSGVPIVARNDARARHPRLLFFTNTRSGTPRRASLAREERLSGSPRAASSCSASPATWRWGRQSPPP